MPGPVRRWAQRAPDGRAGSDEADLVAGEGAEVGEQAAEAAVGAACLVVLDGGLGISGGRSPGPRPLRTGAVRISAIAIVPCQGHFSVPPH